MQYLVIVRLKPDADQAKIISLAKPEAAKAWEMMASGVLRSIHFIKGPVGAALLFEAGDQKAVEGKVAELPLVASDLAAVEVLPLVPFTGWELLFATAT